MSHTPTPWKRGQEGNLRIYGPDGQGEDSGLVLTVHRARDMGFVLCAVNSHQAMKEALESCLEVVGSWDEEPEWALQAKKALTLANGGSTDE